MHPRVAVIGGGISGLSAAHRLVEKGGAVEPIVLEAEGRLGGVLDTRRIDGFLLESAADNFLTAPDLALRLCRRVGLADSLIEPNSAWRRSFVVRHGRLRPIPDGFAVMAPSRLWPIVRSPLLGVGGKLRIGLEYFVPPRSDPSDESLGAFVRRRFGRQVLDRLVQPLVGGIYTADVERLGMDAAMPRFRQMEREHGSLIRAMLARRDPPHASGASGGRYGMFASLADGMSTLVEALAARLPDGAVQLDSPVERLTPISGKRWLLSIGGNRPRRIAVDGVIIAAPAYRAATMLAGVDGIAAIELDEVDYASSAVVSLGYRRSQIRHPLDGFGVVVPLIEQRTILSCSFTSQKYAGRAPDDCVLLRVFIGGACQSGLLRLPGDDLIALAEREAGELLGARGEPVLRRLVRHRRAMPQYHVGHRDRVARIESRLARYPTLALAGSAYGGVGVPLCIQSGERAADRIGAGLCSRRDEIGAASLEVVP
jgi:oxygen-dependent protoporphyrinogen oxidase